MTTTISDFGNKIGGAAKDRAAARGTRATPAGETAAPRARERKAPVFVCYRHRYRAEWWIERKGDRAGRRLREFTTREEAAAFMAAPESQSILVAAWEAARDAGNVTEEKTRGTFNRPRVGPDYRGGIDTTPESFLATFNPFGVEFGHWQTDRASCLNQAHDALRDLAGVLGMRPTDLTFRGTLALAFGARGHGKAAAHYEQGRRVINLTKTAGAGCLAHEWFHAFDHHAATVAGYAGLASESRDPAWAGDLWLTLRAMPKALIARSRAADRTRSGVYWSKPCEVLARAFEAWVRSKVENDYLANITPVESFGPGAAAYPYPLPEEMPAVDAAFRRLFGLA